MPIQKTFKFELKFEIKKSIIRVVEPVFYDAFFVDDFIG